MYAVVNPQEPRGFPSVKHGFSQALYPELVPYSLVRWETAAPVPQGP